MIRHRDRKGRPIGQMEAALLLMDIDRRRVGLEVIGDAEVSTVHLVLLHYCGCREGCEGTLFETLVFRRNEDGEQHGEEEWRYHTLAEAIKGHARAVALVREEEP